MIAIKEIFDGYMEHHADAEYSKRSELGDALFNMAKHDAWGNEFAKSIKDGDSKAKKMLDQVADKIWDILQKPATFEFQIGLAVHDFKNDFDSAKAAKDEAIAEAKAEIKRMVGKIPKDSKMSCKFDEFDSSNPAHATAYFDIKMKGPGPFIKKFERIYKKEFGI